MQTRWRVPQKYLWNNLHEHFLNRGVQYEFGPEYEEYTAKKQAGTVESEEQLDTIPIDNKVRKNYFGQLTDQLWTKGGPAFKAVGEKLVLKSNSEKSRKDTQR